LLGAGAVSVDPIGVALACVAALTYTAYVLFADTAVHRMPPVVLSALVMTGASAALATRALVTGGIDLGFGVEGWFWLACMAVISTVAGMLAFFAGLQRTGPSTAAIVSTFEPVVTTALAVLTLHEFLTPVQLFGGLLVLSSAALVQLPAGSGPRARAASQADRLTEAAEGPAGVAADPATSPPGRGPAGRSSHAALGQEVDAAQPVA
jgi:drug/metabolite transporter (DMT)-like permease